MSRSSCSEVDELREEWRLLIIASDRVTSELLREKRVIFEQELDKQIKVSLSLFYDHGEPFFLIYVELNRRVNTLCDE